jgi:hypothetical protein
MGNEHISAVLARRRPARIAHAPVHWQWFAHHRNPGTLPREVAGCGSQLDLIQRLGLGVFSRNIYCREQRGWWADTYSEPSFRSRRRLHDLPPPT